MDVCGKFSQIYVFVRRVVIMFADNTFTTHTQYYQHYSTWTGLQQQSAEKKLFQNSLIRLTCWRKSYWYQAERRKSEYSSQLLLVCALYSLFYDHSLICDQFAFRSQVIVTKKYWKKSYNWTQVKSWKVTYIILTEGSLNLALGLYDSAVASLCYGFASTKGFVQKIASSYGWPSILSDIFVSS